MTRRAYKFSALFALILGIGCIGGVSFTLRSDSHYAAVIIILLGLFATGAIIFAVEHLFGIRRTLTLTRLSYKLAALFFFILGVLCIIGAPFTAKSDEAYSLVQFGLLALFGAGAIRLAASRKA